MSEGVANGFAFAQLSIKKSKGVIIAGYWFLMELLVVNGW